MNKKPQPKILTRKRKPIRTVAERKHMQRLMSYYMRLAFERMAKEGALTSAHNLGHVQRVSYYAGVYASAVGGKASSVHDAVISGWAHDRLRDPADSMAQKAAGNKTHEILGAEYMKPLFGKRYSAREAKVIFDAMSQHGSLPALDKVGKNVARDAVVFADKFFEANGAYVGFRRSMFMGERKDWRNELTKRKIKLTDKKAVSDLAVEATLKESRKRIAAFSDLIKIPSHMHQLVRYQVQWQHRLVEGLERKDAGIINLVTFMFKEGLKKNPRDLGVVIKNYKPLGKLDAAFKKEATAYLNGELAETFRKLIK